MNAGIDKEGKLLTSIKNLKTLEFAELNNIATHPVFNHIPVQTKYVYLSEMAKEFSFENITACKNIEYLGIAHFTSGD